jgi:hypothetical protein
VFTFCVLEVGDAQLEGLVVSHGHRLSVIIIVLYNSNVAGFIAVTDDAFIVPDLSIRSMPESFVLAVTVSRTESNPSICSLHQVSSGASVILHVRTGLPPLRRLASGLSPVNNTTTATAVVMTATATRLRIVQPLLKCAKICGNDKKIRL